MGEENIPQRAASLTKNLTIGCIPPNILPLDGSMQGDKVKINLSGVYDLSATPC